VCVVCLFFGHACVLFKSAGCVCCVGVKSAKLTIYSKCVVCAQLAGNFFFFSICVCVFLHNVSGRRSGLFCGVNCVQLDVKFG
jgi:hypothetical protein